MARALVAEHEKRKSEESDSHHRQRLEALVAERTQALERMERRLRVMMDGSIQALTAAVGTRDPYTAEHERRVANLACAIATRMGLARDEVEGLRVMGFVHDLGKIAVPSEILSKPGKLNDFEFGLIKSHPQAGGGILSNIEFMWPIVQATLQHHERLDGSGYPAGLRGDQIIREARILAVADVVEAMASHRPYRPALGIDAALREIGERSGTQYDAEVVDACSHVIRNEGFRFG